MAFSLGLQRDTDHMPMKTLSRAVQSSCTLIHSSSVSAVSDKAVSCAWTGSLELSHVAHAQQGLHVHLRLFQIVDDLPKGLRMGQSRPFHLPNVTV